MKRVPGHRYLYYRGGALIFRRGVPASARRAFGGRTEVQKSLNTSSLIEARFRLASEVAKFEAVLARTGIKSGAVDTGHQRRSPSETEIEEGVRRWYSERLARFSMPPMQSHDQRLAARNLVNELEMLVNAAAGEIGAAGHGANQSMVWTAQALIDRNRWEIDEGTASHQLLMTVLGRGQVEAAKHQLRLLSGAPMRVDDETFSRENYRLDEERQSRRASEAPLPLSVLFDEYVAERRPKASTIRAWRRQITALAVYLGHDNARSITHDDLIGWKNHLLGLRGDDGLNPRTVNDTYLAAVRALLTWAAQERRIPTNPAADIRLKARRKAALRSKALTDDEALLILKATLSSPPKRLTASRAFARRWVPWLCAYTGARVNEITQLRRQDIISEKGIWCILITPEAGTVKTDTARVVPLHGHILEQGFLAEIEGKDGPLFYDAARRRSGSDENPQPKKVGEHIARWVREIGVTDPEVQPNHGWRHRFKTHARSLEMDAEARDAIQGHAPRTEGEAYGDRPIETLHAAISLIPAYKIEES